MNTQKKETNERVILEWEAPEFIKHEKGIFWFILAAFAIAGLVFYAIRTDSLSMAIAFIVLAGVYMISHRTNPGTISIKITTLGIQAGKQKIPYNKLKAFWIIYHPPKVKTLKLLTTDRFMTELNLQLDGQAPGAVREQLLKEIPEYEGRGEHFVDALIRSLKL